VLTVRKRQLEKKIELLCLHDVEYRILYYMAELARTFGAKANGSEYSIPLSQGELASLIGATRETTSTTLNLLARRGLIKLGRRQLIVPSVDGVLAAADQRAKAAKVP
jgi:CRP-like cAMP-binding protein